MTQCSNYFHNIQWVPVHCRETSGFIMFLHLSIKVFPWICHPCVYWPELLLSFTRLIITSNQVYITLMTQLLPGHYDLWTMCCEDKCSQSWFRKRWSSSLFFFYYSTILYDNSLKSCTFPFLSNRGEGRSCVSGHFSPLFPNKNNHQSISEHWTTRKRKVDHD